MTSIVRGLIFLSLSGIAFGQLPLKGCDSKQSPLASCPFVRRNLIASFAEASNTVTDLAAAGEIDVVGPDAENSPPGVWSSSSASESFLPASAPVEQRRFHWRRALLESFMFLSIEQAYVVHTDYHWVTVRTGIPFNQYWSDYKHSLNTWIHSGWNDGDPLMYGYVGHPIQGALTSYIQIQNDPRGDALEFSNTKEYWHSRFRATIWNAVYSTQWNIGPLSEITVEKYGSALRSPWNAGNGKWPCNTHHCYTGVGQIDLVMTPIGGLAWTIGEDFLDKNIARRLEESTRNRFLIDVTRCAVNPIRGGASMLHGRRPWWRARDAHGLYLQHQAKKLQDDYALAAPAQ